MSLRHAHLAAAALLGLTTALAALGTNAAAMPSACGETYKIRSGDSLSKIAKSVYGSVRDFQIIYSANADLIGSNPAQINCEIVDRLSEDSQFRCNNLDWSEPMFEQVFGYYTRASAQAPTSHADLLGKTICRPSGYSTFMLEEHDLSAENITLARPSDPTVCFTGLANGEFDAVAMAVDTAEGFITETGVSDEVVYNEDLSQVLTIHAVIAKTNPMAETYLAQLDSGINKMKESGEWFSIIRRHLSAHRALTQ